MSSMNAAKILSLINDLKSRENLTSKDLEDIAILYDDLNEIMSDENLKAEKDQILADIEQELADLDIIDQKPEDGTFSIKAELLTDSDSDDAEVDPEKVINLIQNNLLGNNNTADPLYRKNYNFMQNYKDQLERNGVVPKTHFDTFVNNNKKPDFSDVESPDNSSKEQAHDAQPFNTSDAEKSLKMANRLASDDSQSQAERESFAKAAGNFAKDVTGDVKKSIMGMINIVRGVDEQGNKDQNANKKRLAMAGKMVAMSVATIAGGAVLAGVGFSAASAGIIISSGITVYSAAKKTRQERIQNPEKGFARTFSKNLFSVGITKGIFSFALGTVGGSIGEGITDGLGIDNTNPVTDFVNDVTEPLSNFMSQVTNAISERVSSALSGTQIDEIVTSNVNNTVESMQTTVSDSLKSAASALGVQEDLSQNMGTAPDSVESSGGSEPEVEAEATEESFKGHYDENGDLTVEGKQGQIELFLMNNFEGIAGDRLSVDFLSDAGIENAEQYFNADGEFDAGSFFNRDMEANDIAMLKSLRALAGDDPWIGSELRGVDFENLSPDELTNIVHEKLMEHPFFSETMRGMEPTIDPDAPLYGRFDPADLDGAKPLVDDEPLYGKFDPADMDKMKPLVGGDPAEPVANVDPDIDIGGVPPYAPGMEPLENPFGGDPTADPEPIEEPTSGPIDPEMDEYEPIEHEPGHQPEVYEGPAAGEGEQQPVAPENSEQVGGEHSHGGAEEEQIPVAPENSEEVILDQENDADPTDPDPEVSEELQAERDAYKEWLMEKGVPETEAEAIAKIEVTEEKMALENAKIESAKAQLQEDLEDQQPETETELTPEEQRAQMIEDAQHQVAAELVREGMDPEEAIKKARANINEETIAQMEAEKAAEAEVEQNTETELVQSTSPVETLVSELPEDWPDPVKEAYQEEFNSIGVQKIVFEDVQNTEGLPDVEYEGKTLSEIEKQVAEQIREENPDLRREFVDNRIKTEMAKVQQHLSNPDNATIDDSAYQDYIAERYNNADYLAEVEMDNRIDQKTQEVLEAYERNNEQINRQEAREIAKILIKEELEQAETNNNADVSQQPEPASQQTTPAEQNEQSSLDQEQSSDPTPEEQRAQMIEDAQHQVAAELVQEGMDPEEALRTARATVNEETLQQMTQEKTAETEAQAQQTESEAPTNEEPEATTQEPTPEEQRAQMIEDAQHQVAAELVREGMDPEEAIKVARANVNEETLQQMTEEKAAEAEAQAQMQNESYSFDLSNENVAAEAGKIMENIDALVNDPDMNPERLAEVQSVITKMFEDREFLSQEEKLIIMKAGAELGDIDQPGAEIGATVHDINEARTINTDDMEVGVGDPSRIRAEAEFRNEAGELTGSGQRHANVIDLRQKVDLGQSA